MIKITGGNPTATSLTLNKQSTTMILSENHIFTLPTCNFKSKKITLSLGTMKCTTEMQVDGTTEITNLGILDIQKIISTQPEFMDASGRFNPDFLRRQLSYFDMSEREYISDLKQNIINRHIVSSPVENIAFPKFMDKYIAQIENQQKVFSYVTINPAELKIGRKISDEEIQQYYQDFAPQFEETEKRDISFIELKVDDLSKKITPSAEEISDFYKENESQYVVAEKRYVLQMVLDSKENADKALAELQKGSDAWRDFL